MRKLKNILFLTSIFIVTVAFNFQHNPPSNWYQQFLTIPGSQQINDMTFLDSLTGFIVTSRNVNPDTATIFKTTNGGDNWNVVYSEAPARITRIKFINTNTGFASGGKGTGYPYLYKTTNQGLNWILLPVVTGNIFWEDMAVLNEDTIWCVDKNSFNGGVYRTTNGGNSWERQYSAGSQNPTRVYFYNGRIGFISDQTSVHKVKQTTNSGASWFTTIDSISIKGICFADSITGWISYVKKVYKTTNGGINWITQYLPDNSNFDLVGVYQFSLLNKDTIWGAGGDIDVGSGRLRAVVIKTTNGGINWGYQVPDTAIHNFQYYNIQFVNSKTGWAYTPTSGIHTKLGGDTTIITSVQNNATQTPSDFKLYQNYPNPFNPATTISYQLRTSDHVLLKVFEINGKQIAELINQKQNAGIYTINFNSTEYNLTSGIYFYTLQTENFTETKKMMLVK